MADTPSPNGEGEPHAAAQQAPRLSILTQYVKDLSFENPRAPLRPAAGQARPEIQIQVDVRAAELSDGQYEVVLDLNVDAKAGDEPVFLVELAYGGLFALANIPPDSLQPLLLIECPRLLFPFARRVVADATRDGGFPPLMIDPIDFVALYRRQRAGRVRDRRRPDAAVRCGALARRRRQPRHDAGHVGHQLVQPGRGRVGEAGRDELVEQRLAALASSRRDRPAGSAWRGSRAGAASPTSRISSSVPSPPGRATNASASRDQLLLALEHRRGDAQLGEVVLADLAVEQPLRDDAQHRAARRQAPRGRRRPSARRRRRHRPAASRVRPIALAERAGRGAHGQGRSRAASRRRRRR